MKWQDAERYCKRIDEKLFPTECFPINGTYPCKGFWFVGFMGNHIDAENEVWGSTWYVYVMHCPLAVKALNSLYKVIVKVLVSDNFHA